ncbi:MAG: MBL fold metallo-hydrolase [Anaerolineae bacterium]|nr:MBL fold metallo-hydrolase [Anaerolineae bacterium]
MIRVGDIDITILNESTIRSDTGGMFGLVPKVLWSRYYQPEDDGLLIVPHHCLLVRAAGKTILVDTGNGTKLSERQCERIGLERPEGTLVENLARHGVEPGAVDLVINTHLHGDHCGGNTRFAENGQIVPTFPNAEYLAQRREYADASFPNERTRGTYFAENFAPLYESGRMRLIDGEIEIVPGVRCVITPGHTRAHMSLVFEQDGQAAFYPADLAMLAVHFERLAWIPAYDVEPLVSLESKRCWQQWVREHDALLIFNHDGKIPTGRFTEDEKGRLTVEPAPVDGQ